MTKLTKSTKTISEKAIIRKWHLIDVNGKILGRIANEIATVLQGKDKVIYVPNIDTGDYVVVINAKNITVTGKKADTKTYTNYSGYPSGLRTVSYQAQLKKKPEEIIRHAVSGMLPKNKLRDRRLARLFIYADNNHPYADKIKG